MLKSEKHKIVIGVTGASGAIYAKVLFDRIARLQEQVETVGVLFSKNARDVWTYELENKDFEHLPFRVYEPMDFHAPFASGSAGFDAMIICPCSVGTLGRIASGISNDLMTRAADVMLKERQKLILVVRESPYNLIHINNMRTVTEAGGIICPATPSFYSRPNTFEELAATVVDRALVLAGLRIDSFRWGQNDRM
ncbi:MAG: UbiX family flavin prenyltransferase [Bacteroidales bacterium]|nr:UbiX family flavin prenyltransferase [Bacteroidales bacterium]